MIFTRSLLPSLTKTRRVSEVQQPSRECERKLCASVQVLSPKLPEGAKTTNDETRVKQHFAEGDTG